MDELKTIPYTAIYSHLVSQRYEDITSLAKGKEIMFCGRSNIGKSTLINSLFSNKEACRVSKHPVVWTNQGCTKVMNFYRTENKNFLRYVVDSPGYGYLGMKTKSAEKLKRMIAKYAKESSRWDLFIRLCKIFLLVDLEEGITQHDYDFFDQTKELKMGFDLIFTRADKVKPEHWMTRSLAMTHQLRKYHDIINPVCHLVSSKWAALTRIDFGLNSVRSAMMQAFLEAPTRKIIRKNNKVYYMLEDQTGVPSIEEQKKYRELIRAEKVIYNIEKETGKSETVKRIEAEIRQTRE